MTYENGGMSSLPDILNGHRVYPCSPRLANLSRSIDRGERRFPFTFKTWSCDARRAYHMREKLACYRLAVATNMLIAAWCYGVTYTTVSRWVNEVIQDDDNPYVHRP